MDFIDLGRQYKLIENDLERRFKEILNSKHFIMGPEVEEMEAELAAFCGRKYCLSCASGTDALVIPLMAYSLTREDAVFVPSFTFFASAESVVLAGGTPVFVDVDNSFNMDPESLKREIKKTIEEGKLTPKGIIPVDLFGRSANYSEILPIAKEFGLFVLEDAAQGFGGSLNGIRNGKFGDVSATSFFPAKPMGCYGDGGAIFTDDEEMFELMKSIRVHGQGKDKYDNERIGLNGRMDTIQAAVILAKLPLFERELLDRQRVADYYSKRLDGIFDLPIREDAFFSSWAQYTLKARNRGEREHVLTEMKSRNIPVMVYYPIPLHMQKAFSFLNYRPADLPNCRDIAERVFSLPMHPYLSNDEIDYICDNLMDVVKEYRNQHE